MPLYDYICTDCVETKQLDEETQRQAMFETRHCMNPSKKELKITTQCPHCGSGNTVRALSAEFIFYMKGKAWEDKAGIKRDMNVYKLVTKDEDGKSNDPYVEHRVPGETDHLVHTFKQQGKHQTKPVVFDTGKK